MSEALPHLLIVDDEPPVRDYLSEAVLTCCGKVKAVESLHAALHAFETEQFDILLTDVCMPGASGLDLLALAQQLSWDCAIILMTGHAELDQVVAGVRLHAADFLLKPFGIDTLHRSVHKAFEKLQSMREGRRQSETLSAGLRERTEQLRTMEHLLSDSYRSALETLVATLEAREPETYAHSFRVRAYALHLATVMRYPPPELPLLAHAALLHDMGKVAVSDSILLKPGALSKEEFDVLKTHAVVGERIINRMGFLAGAGNIVRHHHERWDGRGYPDGIAGTQIPFGSRLFAVADSMDAMTSNRCYRSSMPIETARAEIQRCAGSQFDPVIAEVFRRIPDEVWVDLRRQADRDAHAAIIPELNLPAGAYAPALLPPSPAIGLS